MSRPMIGVTVSEIRHKHDVQNVLHVTGRIARRRQRRQRGRLGIHGAERSQPQRK